MYSLVALGFVLIYKASGVFNFGAGRDGVLRGPHDCGIHVDGRPFWLRWRFALLAMVALAFFTERMGAAPLVNQPADHALHGDHRPAFFIEGIAQPHLGAHVHALDLVSPTSRSNG